MTQARRKVFIVEDEVLVAFEMTDTLEDLGFTVVGPSVHLASATRAAETADIDIAFLDVNLGRGMTSKPIADILDRREIPFVYITAYNRDQVSFIRAQDRMIKKPVSAAELVKVLNKVLPS